VGFEQQFAVVNRGISFVEVDNMDKCVLHGCCGGGGVRLCLVFGPCLLPG
jgi:Fe-S oxidoreductase